MSDFQFGVIFGCDSLAIFTPEEGREERRGHAVLGVATALEGGIEG